MADITIASPAAVGPQSVNWLGTQLIARGGVTGALAAQIAKALGRAGGSPLTCAIQKQSDSSPIASGTVYTNGTVWVARFGPLTNVDGSTEYQIVANAPTFAADTSSTVKQLYFNSGIQIAFNPNTPTQFPRQFSVGGTFLTGSGYTATCLLMNGCMMVAAGNVTVDQPQAGQWTASFNLPSNQSNCWLLAEMHNATPLESVGAAWIDNVSVTG
jgi:hypothetical protein